MGGSGLIVRRCDIGIPPSPPKQMVYQLSVCVELVFLLSKILLVELQEDVGIIW